MSPESRSDLLRDFEVQVYGSQSLYESYESGKLDMVFCAAPPKEAGAEFAIATSFVWQKALRRPK